MARKKRENRWKNLMVQLDEDLYNKLKADAEKEHRSLVGTLELILSKYYDDSEGMHLDK